MDIGQTQATGSDGGTPPPPPPSPPSNDEGFYIASRYRVVRLIDRGAHGEVFEAIDRITKDRVAVKVAMRSQAATTARSRLEISSLRLLRIPGVVRLLDDGMWEGRIFVVTELLRGEPYPGAAGAATMDQLLATTISLIDTLTRIHAEGIVHRDLKPKNVLVDALGFPTVLDFGISVARQFGSSPRNTEPLAGTPAYLAPEQVNGGEVGAAADLYAVAVMFYEATAKRLPFQAETMQNLLLAKQGKLPVSLLEAASDVPRAVAEIIDELLHPSPEKRPAAAEVLAVLRGQVRPDAATPLAAVLAGMEPKQPWEHYTVDELTRLFSGRERVFHLPTDAARALFSRTEGRREAVETELSSWLRAGLAHLEGARLALNRDALDWLELGLDGALLRGAQAPSSNPVPLPTWEANAPFRTLVSEREDSSVGAQHRERARSMHRAIAEALATGEGRLLHLVTAQNDDEDELELAQAVAREGRAHAEKLAKAGHLGKAVVVLSESLSAVRRHADKHEELSDLEEPLLYFWAEVALAIFTPLAIDRLLYEVARAQPSRERDHLEALLLAALMGLEADGKRALQALAEVPPFKSLPLERKRQSLRLYAARRYSTAAEAEVLREAEAWARSTGDPVAIGAIPGWVGRLRYGQGRFEEGAELHAEAAENEPWIGDRVFEMLAAASAMLECFRPRPAARYAEDALLLARTCRNAHYEARAEWLLRTAAYRQGKDVKPDIALVDATQHVGAGTQTSIVSLCEAAFAWRRRELETARELAQIAYQTWSRSGRTEAAAAARSIMIASGSPTDTEEVMEIANVARQCKVPGLAIQMLALLAMARPDLQQDFASGAEVYANQVLREHWDKRIDVMSVNEALALLGGPARELLYSAAGSSS